MIIKSSNELRKNYNSIAEICRTTKTPVFLSSHNDSDGTVSMDLETYNRREENLTTAERFLVVEHSRLNGESGYTINEFKQNMKNAIKQGTVYVE